jgi:hypothetical protein
LREFTVDMGSRAAIYTLKFHEIGSGIQKLMEEKERQTAW